MQQTFDSIEKFIALKEKCVFCQTPLKNMLTNHIRAPRGIPILKSEVIDGKLSFKLKHTTDSYQIIADGTIDTKTNLLHFQLSRPDTELTNLNALDSLVAKTAFEQMMPHMEVYCPSRKCKTKYYICGEMFKIDVENLNGCVFRIRPFSVYMESFFTSKLWIQNDWSANCTNIYLKNNPVNPVKTSILDLESMDKEKLFKRIKTLVTFS